MSKKNAVTIEDARWAAIRAGFPYHVSEVIVGDVLIDQFPQDLAVLLDDRRPEHLGLARVRRGSQDRWVALIASGGWMQGSFSRELELAEELSVEGQGQWHLTAPNGERKAGQLPLEVKLDQPGEWWLEVGQAGQAQSRLPLYVDGGTPVTNFSLAWTMAANRAPQPSWSRTPLISLMRCAEDLGFLCLRKTRC